MISVLYLLNLLFILSSCFLFCANSYWNFSHVNLSKDILIWRFAVWRSRAFLAVPRWQARLESTINYPTLLEAPWPEISSTIQLASNSRVLPFPNYDCQLANGDCRNLQSVTGLDVDSRGRLWILDAPTNNECQGKIIVYDLRRYDLEVSRSELVGVSTKGLTCLIIDPVIGTWGYRAYIGDPENESIIVYSLGQRRWWRLKLLHGAEVPRVSSNDLAISRWSFTLYLTGFSSHDLFSVNLERSRNDEGPPAVLGNEGMQNVSVSWLGSKLGSSSGLICDLKGGLHYFMVTEHASVRWDTKLDLKAESHSILLQTEDVPCITDYIMDFQKNIWGLANTECPFGKKTTVEANGSVSEGLALKSRTRRIYKYSPFFL